MPLYEYQCDACGHRFEKIQKFSDPIVDTCPVCGGPVHKLLSSPAIQFKGSGFYITDYAKKDQGGAEKSDAKAGEKDKTSKSDSDSTKTEKADKPAAPAAADKKSSTSSSESSSSSGSSGTTSPKAS